MNLPISVDLIKVGLEELCRRNKACKEYCHVYLKVVKWDNIQAQNLLSSLSELLLNPECTEAVAESFPALLLQILSHSFSGSERTPRKDLHKVRCVVLGKLVTIHLDAVKFSLEYFRRNPPPFHVDKYLECVSPHVKRRKVTTITVSDYDLVLATYHFLSTSCEHWRQHWNWSMLLEYLKHQDEVVRWLACQCIATVSGMAYSQRQTMTSKFVSKESTYNLCLKFEEANKKIKTKKFVFTQESTHVNTAQNEFVTVTSPFVVSVAGVLLPVYDSSQVCEGNLVLVPSTTTNLRSLALAVAAGKAVCLEGPVGCGKTALVEHLALITGRRKSPNFIKVQLGDQTDSKMLLGTYRCTDVPGEFVWQPGVLTQAVIGGHWILLEDIDSAPTDVIAVLASLMETGSISVPGYRDTVHASPGFQLFTSQRLIPGNIGGFHKQQIGSTSLMEKLWIKVSMEPLSGRELIHVVKTLYPVLNTITPRLLDVFLLFSAGKHHTSLPAENCMDDEEKNAMESEKEPTHQPHSLGSRLTSTRDLLKWCARIVVGYDVSSQESSLNVLSNAVDVFCCSVRDPARRVELAANVAACLGIVRLKAEYVCHSCKPSVNSSQEHLSVGRAKMKRLVDPKSQVSMKMSTSRKSNFCLTRPTCQLLERVGVCITRGESVLLVGETGTGKTSVVQFLSNELNARLIVLNMNQQSDTADLLGGYKPVDLKFIVTPIKEKFESLFVKTFSRKQNVKFLEHISTCYQNRRWKILLKLMKHSSSAGVKRATSEGEEEKGDVVTKAEWLELLKRLERLEVQIKNSALAFSFIEGSLVKALREGWWVLLDEINLASGETLECLSGLLEGVGDINGGSLCLHERGDTTPIVRHPNFRLFACMNPATDVGKKDLPPGLRNRFTEFFVDELIEKTDLVQLAGSYLSAFVIPSSVLENIVSFYLKVRKEAVLSLSDGTGHKPHYSLRTLCRALTVAAKNPCGAYTRSLYEAFCLGFLTQLDRTSHPIVEAMISKALFKGDKENKSSVIKKSISEPTPHGSHICIEGYWVRKGSLEPAAPKRYILTPSVRQNLRDLARIMSLSGGSQPALIQGETSVGKTSLIEYLAAATGNVALRVNNHEHTDLQEYVGAYTADPETGKMVFHEGVLVEAMRKGYWIILDELNLAPSDVLEALNRVLDDNRELYIAETQEVVQAHPHFMLFATQNPPGHYGGRKLLSRAFRNRFVELHFDEIPPEELRTILEMRCDMPPSYCKKLVAVMNELQIYRRGSAMFAGKQGFITLRDLFRWGERYRLAKTPQEESTFYDWDLHLAHEGYLLLAGRVRKEEERVVIAEAIKKHLNRTVNPEELFTLNTKTSPVTRPILEELVLTVPPEGFRHLVWTQNMRRQAVLLAKAFQFDEPVLLVGETGIGKTTVCQLLAALRSQKLRSVNCHMHTEGADFLGGLRPVREPVDESDSNTTRKLFEWVDGPLIKAMLEGDLFLADEISLADDSVLERLNSLLEPERKLLLAEKGGGGDGVNSAVVVAHGKFHFVGTMNPGGDFGKKELSPALRNRFTEIWCEGCRDRGDLMCLIEENLRGGLSLANQEDATSGIGHIILDFVDWFSLTDVGKRFTISIRDFLNWINFINVTTELCDTDLYNDDSPSAMYSKLDLPNAIVHGACFTFLDSLGSGISSSEKASSLSNLHKSSVKHLVDLVQKCSGVHLEVDSFLTKSSTEFQIHPTRFGTEPFFITVGNELMYHDISIMQRFSFDAPTSGNNARRLLRALQIGGRPILLEGSPGVGKTALVAALANGANHRLVRINLSEQTDVSDLFGADLPVEGGEGGQFSWRDGPFLQALKSGSWIVLDELNLASQSVLEGLNAALDHRGEVFVPELGRSFSIHKNTTRIFACQNPLNQGGARRGLPRSFLNRFTQVYIDSLTSEDLEFILTSAFPAAPRDLISRAVSFNAHLVQETQEQHLWGHRGAPWEFNLRDLLRWFESMNSHYNFSKKYGSGPKWEPAKFVQLLYVDRMRTSEDKEKVKQHYMNIFSSSHYKEPSWDPPRVRIGKDIIWFGDISLMRSYAEPLTSPLAHNAHPRPNQLLLHRASHALRSLAVCVQMKWLPILVGGIGSGKTSLVQLLAHLTGNELRIMPVNSSMDTTEILGGFEQTDYSRHFDIMAEKAERLVMHSLRKHLLSSAVMSDSTSNSSGEENFSMTRNLLRRWEEFQRLGSNFHKFVEKCCEIELFQRKMNSLQEALKAIEQACTDNIADEASCILEKLEKLWKQIKKDGLLPGGNLKVEYKRQFESLASGADFIVTYDMKNIRKAVQNKKESIKRLRRLWEEFKHNQLMPAKENELPGAFPMDKLFKQRLTLLKEVLQILKFDNVVEVAGEAESMMWQLENLEGVVESGGGKLNGGGKFEWIDSILVKCLKEGCWLMVENVNLCSSAVLDRLNALLEPNGTLTIGERGVGPHDEPPTIIPHPDFRLFFTLDPRHGQISRAMRNRGVEIFVLGPEEGVEYDLMDTRALLSEAGVESVDLQAKLVAIHNVMSAKLIGPDKPSLPQLLQVAFLLHQQLSHSPTTYNSMKDSLRSSFCDMYIRSQKGSVDGKRASLAILDEAIQALSESETVNGEIADSVNLTIQKYVGMTCKEVSDWHITLRCSDLQMDTFGAFSRQRGILLEVALPCLAPGKPLDSFPGFPTNYFLKNVLPEVRLPETHAWRSGLPRGPLSPESLPAWKFIPRLILAYYATASADESIFRHKYLMTLTRPLKESMKIIIGKMSENVSDLVSRFPSRPDKPWDPRWWNTWEPVDQKVSAWALLMELKMIRIVEEGREEGKLWWMEIRKRQKVTLTLKDIHEHVKDGSLPGALELQHSTQPISNQFISLCQLVDTVLESILLKYSGSVNDWGVLWNALQWRARFVALGFLPICKADKVAIPQQVEDLLWIHVKWILKHVARPLAWVGPATNSEISSSLVELTETLLQLEKSQSKASYPVIHLAKEVSVKLGWPNPYSREEEVIVAKEIGSMEKALCHDSYNTDLCSSNLCALLTPEGVRCHQDLISAHLKLSEGDIAEATAVSNSVMETCKSIGLRVISDRWQQNAKQPEEHKSALLFPVGLADAVEAQLWPFNEIILISLSALLKKIILTKLADFYSVEDKSISFGEGKKNAEKVLSTSKDSSVGNVSNLVDVNQLLPIASSLYFAAMHSTSTSPRLVASVKRLHDLLKAVSIGESLSTKEWLFNVHEFIVSSAIQDEKTVARTDIIAWTKLQGLPVQDENDMFSQFQPKERSEDHIHLHCPVLSLVVTSLVMSDELNKNAVLRSIPLKLHRTRRLQLKVLSETLWKNLSALCSEEFIHRINDAKSAVASSSALLDVLSFNSTLNENLDKWDTMLSLFTNLLEEKNRMLVETLQLWMDGHKDEVLLISLTGMCWSLYGGLCVLLRTASGLVDPAQKRAIKTRYLTEELEDIHLSIYTHDMHSKIELGLNLDDLSLAALHPYLFWLKNRESILKEKLVSLSDRIAARPTPSTYYELSKTLHNYVMRIGSPETLDKLQKKLSEAMHDLSKNDDSAQNAVLNANRALQEVYSMRKSLLQFAQQLSSQFGSWYREMVTPVVGSIHQIIYGLSLQASAVEKVLFISKNNLLSVFTGTHPSSLDDFVSRLVCFPSVGPKQPSLCNLAKVCVATNTVDLLEKVFDAHDISTAEKERCVKIQALRLMMVGLEEVKNELAVRKEIGRGQKAWDALMTVLWNLSKAWKKDQEMHKIRKAEEESLFSMRCANRPGEDDDQIDPTAVALEFPTYKEDFEDLQPVSSLSDDNSHQAQNAKGEDTSQRVDFITEENMVHIADLHSNIVTSLTISSWLVPNGVGAMELRENVDYLEPLLERYSVFSHFLSYFGKVLTSDIDVALYPSLTLLSAIALQESYGLCDNMESRKIPYPKNKGKTLTQTGNKEHPDFYRDPWQEETIHCFPILKGLKTEVQKLMISWPEHPVLNQICVVVDRILEFPPTSPLSRFVTGLELTLAKAQEWEANAHSGISLCNHLTLLTTQIIEWRRLELSCWKDCLNKSVEKAKARASKWWFHLFWLVHTYVKPEEDDTFCDQEEGFKATEPQELLTLLKQLMEDSSLGEFETRLDLLYTFHCHTIHMESSDRQRDLQRMLWNVHSFYSQFRIQVRNHLQKLRKPIEKKMKDFVKIARWNDISYWSVKETVSKIHRTLHKHIKEFEKVLQQPVTPALTQPKEKESSEEGIWDKDNQASAVYLKEHEEHGSCLPSVEPSYYISQQKLLHIIQAPQVASNPLISHSGSYFNRARHLCKEIMASFKYPALIHAVETMTVEVIDTATHLSSLQVPVGLAKAKQRSAAKNIIQRKRRALADLFQALTRLGLSYRTGLMISEKQNSKQSLSSSLDMFLMPPLDINAALNQLKSRKADSYLLKMWDGCEKYYVRSMARLAHLNLLLSVSPSKDLGPPSIERFRGFTSHLMHIAKQQKEHLTCSTNHLVTFRRQLSYLSSLGKNDENCPIPCQDLMRNLLACLSDLVCSGIVCLVQTWLYLHACPSSPTSENEIVRVVKLPSLDDSSVSGLENALKGDEKWQCATDDIRLLVAGISQLKSEIERLNLASDLPITPSHWAFILRAGNSLEKFADRIGKTRAVLFGNFSNSSNLPSTAESLDWLVNEMMSLSRKIDSEKVRISQPSENTVTPDDVSSKNALHAQLANRTESLLKKVLLIFQSFFKKYSAKEGSEEKQEVGEDKTAVVEGNVVQSELLSEDKERVAKDKGLEEIEERHLSEKINKSISADVEMLQLGDVILLLQELITDLSKLMDQHGLDPESHHCKRLLLSCLPALDQLSLLAQFLITQQTVSYRTTSKLLSALLAIFSDLASRGFCIPPGLDGEEGKEDGPGRGDGKWEEIEGVGLGDAEDGDEKAKETSDKLESEDQLEGAHQEGKEPEDKADKDLKEEETGVEMSEDFEGKLQELGEKEEGEDESGEEEDDDDDVDKQMGKTGSEAEKLDDQIWGSDSEDEDEGEEGEEKGSEGEDDRRGGKGEQPELSAKDQSLGKADEKEEEGGEGEEDKKKKQKDINEMEDKGEIDDDQLDPYHGNQEPLPEPEPLDLPDDLQLDDGEAKDKDGNEEENPFDIDTMKDQMGDGKDADLDNDDDKASQQGEGKEAEDEKDGEEEEGPEGEGLKQDRSEEMEVEDEEGKAEEAEDTRGKGGKEEEEKEEEGKVEGKDEDVAEPSDDQPSTVPVEGAADTPKEGSKDKTECTEEDMIMEEGKNEEDNKETHGVGLAQEERKRQGHGGHTEDASVRREEMTKEEADKEERKRRRKPGELDSKRTLGESIEPLKKKLKTVEIESRKGDAKEEDEKEGIEEDKETEQEPKGEEGELYEHVKEAEQRSDALTLDAATEDQSKMQPIPNTEEEEADKNIDADDEVAMQEDEPVVLEEESPSVQKPEEMEESGGEKKKKAKKEDDKKGEGRAEGKVEVEGEVVATVGAQRGVESTFHTQHSALEHEPDLVIESPEELRQKLEQQLAEWSQPPAGDEALVTWESFVALTEGLSRDLSEQLRLVLEPTQASRLRGDYRTGRRINMRKVIPYIASQFRKDKIWLRRTKPSKREYQIVLAIDDSSSMADNHSKELAFESLALVSRALTLLEAGQLAVVSFGESVKVLHPLSEPFSEHSGARLLQQFSFDQKKTWMGNLMDTVTTMLCGSKTSCTPGVGVAQLLVIVSDGRGVWNEGSDQVKNAVRRAQDSGIFTVFVIVDNPASKDSIMDIRMPIFKDGKMLGISSYLDNFPFPFYLILRDINALPGVLSDALRQWFELVTEMDKQ